VSRGGKNKLSIEARGEGEQNKMLSLDRRSGKPLGEGGDESDLERTGRRKGRLASKRRILVGETPHKRKEEKKAGFKGAISTLGKGGKLSHWRKRRSA